MRRRYLFELRAPATDETDAAILADVLVEAVRDERNDPHEPVDVRFRPDDPDDPDLPERSTR